MYVTRADCSSNAGNKDSFVLKEGQFVEVLDAFNPERWLVRTKPSKTNPARQGWVCPAYLEKKRKVRSIILSKKKKKQEKRGGLMKMKRFNLVDRRPSHS